MVTRCQVILALGTSALAVEIPMLNANAGIIAGLAAIQPFTITVVAC